MKKAIIIGAGIGGLGAAVRLACKGYAVQVFEAQARPGGKLGLIEQPGYRYDLGPSLFTMPQYVDDLFRLAGKEPKDYFIYERLETICHYFWDDGTNLDAFANPAAFANEAAKKLHCDAGEVLTVLQDAKAKYDACGQIFLENSLHKAKTWLQPSVLKAMLKIPSLGLFSTMHKSNLQRAKHPKLVQLFDRFATYNGSDPYKTPGLLSMIPHFEHGMGAYYPSGGMYQITEAVYELALSLGIQFHFNTPVKEILVEQGRAVGVALDETNELADIVVSNMDIFFTYKQLLAKERQPERTLKQEKSSSGIVFYWGIKRSFPQLGLHNIMFSNDYEAEFATMRKGSMSNDPTVYINISSKLTPTDAPAGCENWFVLINAPFNNGQDWDSLVAETRANVLRKVSHVLKCDVSELIEHETILDPRSIEQQTGSHLGALYGTSSNHRMSAFLRHPNFSNQIAGLYFVGGSVHPGGGIPLALLSAKIVADWA